MFRGMPALAATIICWAAPLSAQAIDADLLARLLDRHKPETLAFEFAAIGDQQYGAEGEQKWPALQTSINNAPNITFTVHVGDIKSGASPCTNDMFANRLAAFNEFNMPLIYTPGDNEWTDCHTAAAGAHDPLERLDYLRRTFFTSDRSLGKQTIALSRQSEDPKFTRYVENAIWSHGPILFATIHVVGSNNNLGRNAENDLEYRERGAANASWLAAAFKVAKENGFAGMVLVIHANPGWVGTPVRAQSLATGFREFYRLLEEETIAFEKPVLTLTGDTHIFRIDKPMVGTRSLRVVDNFFRAEVPGDIQAHWLRVKVDPARRPLFSIDHEDVPQNYSIQPRP